MNNAVYNFAHPKNEPIFGYEPGSTHRGKLMQELERQSSEVIDIPLIINGEEVFTEKRIPVIMPHDHGHILAYSSYAGPKEINMAAEAAINARQAWMNLS